MKNPTCFIPLHPYNDQFQLPEKLDFPFFYEPTSIAVYAAEELQKTLTENNFSHNFGIENAERNGAIGKMFGVLIVQNKLGELGYLKAFSGKLADSNIQPGFVPPVFDILEKDGFFKQEEAIINKLNARIEEIETDTFYIEQKENHDNFSVNREKTLSEFRTYLKTK